MLASASLASPLVAFQRPHCTLDQQPVSASVQTKFHETAGGTQVLKVYLSHERTCSHSAYDITISSYDAFHTPVATLTLGANNALGAITYARDRIERQMESYLSQVNAVAG